MNTLHIEARLAEKYKYKPLPDDLSEKYREYFRTNIPRWLSVEGTNETIYTSRGSVISNGYDRIVIGDYGAFIEFSEDQASADTFIIPANQRYRVDDERYSKNVKYIWMTVPDGSEIKIYFQKKTVTYADYLPGKYYVSVHEAYMIVEGPDA